MSETSRNLNVRKCLSFCGDSVYRSFSRNIMKEFYNPSKRTGCRKKNCRKLEKSRNWYLSIAREFFTSRIKFYFPRQRTSSWNLVLAIFMVANYLGYLPKLKIQNFPFHLGADLKSRLFLLKLTLSYLSELHYSLYWSCFSFSY